MLRIAQFIVALGFSIACCGFALGTLIANNYFNYWLGGKPLPALTQLCLASRNGLWVLAIVSLIYGAYSASRRSLTINQFALFIAVVFLLIAGFGVLFGVSLLLPCMPHTCPIGAPR